MLRAIKKQNRAGLTVSFVTYPLPARNAFICKLTVRSSLWNAKANKASGKSLESQCVNEKLENIKTNIHK